MFIYKKFFFGISILSIFMLVHKNANAYEVSNIEIVEVSSERHSNTNNGARPPEIPIDFTQENGRQDFILYIYDLKKLQIPPNYYPSFHIRGITQGREVKVRDVAQLDCLYKEMLIKILEEGSVKAVSQNPALDVNKLQRMYHKLIEAAFFPTGTFATPTYSLIIDVDSPTSLKELIKFIDRLKIMRITPTTWDFSSIVQHKIEEFRKWSEKTSGKYHETLKAIEEANIENIASIILQGGSRYTKEEICQAIRSGKQYSEKDFSVINFLERKAQEDNNFKKAFDQKTSIDFSSEEKFQKYILDFIKKHEEKQTPQEEFPFMALELSMLQALKEMLEWNISVYAKTILCTIINVNFSIIASNQHEKDPTKSVQEYANALKEYYLK